MTTPSAEAGAVGRSGLWGVSLGVLGRLPPALTAPLLAALFVGPLLLVALAAERATAFFWFALLADLVLLFAFALATFRRPLLFVSLLVVWFVMQRLVLALVAPHVSADVLRLLFTYKEGFYMILLAAAAVGAVFAYSRGERSLTPIMLADVLALALLALLMVNFLLFSAELSPKLTYARRFAAPLLLYLGGRLLLPDRQQLVKGLRLLVLMGLVVALFGLVERFLLDVSFWSDRVDALGFYGRQVEAGLLPTSFIRPFQGVPEGIFVAFPVDVPVRRLVSTYLEPTTLGAFLALGLLLLVFVPGLALRQAQGGRGRIVVIAASAVLTLAVVATVSRGAMQIALIGGGMVLLLTAGRALRWPWRLESAIIVGGAAILLVALMITSLSFSQAPNRRQQLQDVLSARIVSGLEPVPKPPPTEAPLNKGAQAHVNGLTSGLRQMLEDPGGIGLGTAGAWSEAPEIGSESTVGTLAAQLGVPGLSLWLAFYAAVIGGLVQAGLRLRREGERLWSDVALVLGAALTGLFVTAWFSESASGLLGNAFFFLFAGWVLAVVAPAASGLRFRWLPFDRLGTGSFGGDRV